MRDELKKYNKKTVAVSGTFVRFGKKKSKITRRGRNAKQRRKIFARFAR